MFLVAKSINKVTSVLVVTLFELGIVVSQASFSAYGKICDLVFTKNPIFVMLYYRTISRKIKMDGIEGRLY